MCQSKKVHIFFLGPVLKSRNMSGQGNMLMQSGSGLLKKGLVILFIGCVVSFIIVLFLYIKETDEDDVNPPPSGIPAVSVSKPMPLQRETIPNLPVNTTRPETFILSSDTDSTDSDFI